MLEFIFLILISWLFFLNCYKVTASTESGVHDISHWNLLTEFSQGRYVYLVVFFLVWYPWPLGFFCLIPDIKQKNPRGHGYQTIFFSCQIGCGNYSWYFQYVLSLFEEMFEDTKGVIKNRSVTDNVMAKRKKDKHDRKYTTRKGFSNTNPIKNLGWMHALRKGRQFLLHTWHPSCYSCYKPSDKSWMRKGQYHDYDKLNISVVICDTDSATDNRGLALSI